RGVVVVLVVHLSCNHDAIMMQSGRPVNRCQYFFSLLNPCFPALFRACLDFRGRERAAAEGRRIGREAPFIDLAAEGGASSPAPEHSVGAWWPARHSSVGRGKPDLPAGEARARATPEAACGA